ncbi:MAG: bis(5'-nucleosyl)-tetraphosphatase (symmetrical) YqeK [Anaeroplasmataceae bacterium]
METSIKLIKERLVQKYGIFDNRYIHIQGVYNLAIKLADLYGADIKKVEVASLLHDFYKSESNEFLLGLLNNEDDLKNCIKYPFLTHSYVNSTILKTEFNIYDDEIKQAIKSHTVTNLNPSTLDKIIMVSDFAEENRKFKEAEVVRKIALTENLDKAFDMMIKLSVEHLESKGFKNHPNMIQMYNKIKENEK